MHPFYIIIYIVFSYTLRIFYPNRKIYNKPKGLKGSTIYVSNHAASFMDPLVIARFGGPIVFFMTRSDVFTKISTPFLTAVHMLPIYRQQDGEDTKKKNEEVFQRCSSILKSGRSLLIFGEGFTDDVFIRRLKPVKKGAVRIGFQTLDNINWSKEINIAAVGCNYAEPNELGSDFVLSYSDKICLNDYKEAYEENPNKVINELTKHIEALMQEQITHVANKEIAPFHENIMKITRKGMNSKNHDKSIPLLKRWEYSKKLATWINAQDFETNTALNKTKDKAESYFKLLNRFKLEENLVFWKKENPNGSRLKEILMILLLFPFSILGFIHCAVPYILVKKFVHKSFKRSVFWASVKMLLGSLAMGIINIPAIFIFYYLIYPSWLMAFAYYTTIGLTGLAAYILTKNVKLFVAKGKVNKTDLTGILKKRDDLEQAIIETTPNI